jgi:uncharacterized protein (DUF362 family)/Pyruvate/2-oxoacid:ferredoxin oxidoreductase delta subunit
MTRVSIVKCADYDRARVEEAVKRAVDLVGGMASFVKPGMKVLIKPNLLSERKPDDGVDTHPEVVRAVVKLVKAEGAIPVIGDSPGGYGKNIEEIFEASGMGQISREEGVELIKFTNSKFVDGIPFSRHIFEVDRIISVPKMKTHCITIITAGIKNMFGAVTGLYKAGCHSAAPKEEDFAGIIAKVFSIARPHLTVLDGVVAMEGDGPSGGMLRKMSLIMASRDAVAMDSCVARVMGIEPADVRVTIEAYVRGLGEMDPSRIEIAGGKIEDFIAKDFKMPQTTPLKVLPRAVLKALAVLVRFKPVIDTSLCKRCNLCKVTCPVDCITIEKGYCRIEYKKCVKCLCCHEVCPYKAIEIKRNFLAKVIWG